MTKTEYLESQRGVPYRDIVANQPKETVTGTIRGDNLRDVVAILAAGLQYRLDTMVLQTEVEPVRTALQVAFRHLGMDNYGINLSLPENMALLTSAVDAGLVTTEEKAKFIELASYERSTYDITIRDCVAYFEPGKLGVPTIWDVLNGVTTTSMVVLRLRAPAPESCNVVVQMQDVYPDGSESDWYFCTTIRDVHEARAYRAMVPNNGYPHRMRWQCSYVLSADLLAV